MPILFMPTVVITALHNIRNHTSQLLVAVDPGFVGIKIGERAQVDRVKKARHNNRLAAGHPCAADYGEKYQDRADPMRHLQTDLERGDVARRGHVETLLIVSLQRRLIHRRPEFAIGQRKIFDRQTRVLMPHCRTQNELQEN